MWRLLHNCIPTDSRVKSIGIPLPSKCHCCKQHSVEDVNHLFLKSDWASFLWSSFHRSGCEFRGHSVNSMIINTIQNTNGHSLFGLFKLAALGVGLWEIWLARNAPRFDRKLISPQGLFHKVISQVKQVISTAKLREDQQLSRTILAKFGISATSRTAPLVKIVKWLCPPWPFLKINTDGAHKHTGHSGGGGIIRNFQGHILLAFSHYYENCPSLVAEARALADGIKYLSAISSKSALVESDSLLLIQVLNKQTDCPWEILPFIREIWSFSPQIKSFAHVYREVNQAADYLANFACQSQCNSFFTSQHDLPSETKGASRLDKLGMPSIRVM